MCRVDRPHSKGALLVHVTSERFDEFVAIHQFHLIATPEEVRVIRKDTASPHIYFVATLRKDAVVVRCADDLQLKTVESLLSLPIQHWHIHIQQTQNKPCLPLESSYDRQPMT